jgi:hypothetical protein
MLKNYSKFSKNSIFLVISVLFFTSSVQAQYVWLDEKGSKQFSDVPPPANIPAQKILKMPSRSATKATPGTEDLKEASSGNTDAASALKKPVTTASKNEDFNKRQLELEEKNKKALIDQQVSTDKIKNCARARSYQRSLESGERIASIDKNGERNFISDARRDQDLIDTKKALSDCK